MSMILPGKKFIPGHPLGILDQFEASLSFKPVNSTTETFSLKVDGHVT